MNRIIVAVACSLLLVVSISWSVGCSMARTNNENTTSNEQQGQDAGTTDKTVQEGTSSKINLILNEVAASGDPDDWVEIYNAGDKEVDLSGYTLSDDPAQLDKASFPKGTSIAAGEYKVFYLNDQWPAFKLGKAESFVMADPAGKVILKVSWEDGQSPAGGSYGRFPDRTGEFKTLVTPTPGKANVDDPPKEQNNNEVSTSDAGPQEVASEPLPEKPATETVTEQPGTQGKLVINEVAAAGDPNDWFELYNGSKQSIDLSKYSVSDNLQDAKARVTFPKGTVIKPGEYIRFEVQSSPDWPGFKLGSDEELGLYDADGNLVDSVDWNKDDSPSGKSFGRIPSGSGPFQTLDTPSPGQANTK